MEIFELKKEFDRIVKENDFAQPQKLQKVLDYLKQGSINIEDFSKKFNLTKEDSEIFLQFLQKGIEFKKNIDESKN